MTVFLGEMIKAIGRIFINPTIYWILLIMLIPSYERLKVERHLFQQSTQSFLAEAKDTWPVSLLGGGILSLFTASVGITFTYEIIIILSIFIVIFSITYRYTLLSASYTLGATFVFLKFLAVKQPNNPVLIPEMFTSLSLLIGILLLFEALLFFRMEKNDAFPEIIKSKRGKWIGLNHLKKIAIIPILLPIPEGPIPYIEDFWPYITAGEESFSLFIFPFVFGFHQIVQSEIPYQAAQKLGKMITSLSVLTIIFAFISFFFPGLSTVAVLLAIVGRFYIFYKTSQIDHKKHPLFIEGNGKLQILGIVSGSPADEMGLKVGDIIKKVNEIPVHSVKEFDQLVHEESMMHTIEIVDQKNKVHKIHNDSFQGNRLHLGFLFAVDPRQKRDK